MVRIDALVAMVHSMHGGKLHPRDVGQTAGDVAGKETVSLVAVEVWSRWKSYLPVKGTPAEAACSARRRVG